MKINAEEISSIIRQEIENYNVELEATDVGTVMKSRWNSSCLRP